jgi:hypothetical protein
VKKILLPRALTAPLQGAGFSSPSPILAGVAIEAPAPALQGVLEAITTKRPPRSEAAAAGTHVAVGAQLFLPLDLEGRVPLPLQVHVGQLSAAVFCALEDRRVNPGPRIGAVVLLPDHARQVRESDARVRQTEVAVVVDAHVLRLLDQPVA